MSNNYDNWERLVEVVLRREKDREVALADSRGSSFSSISSSFRLGQNPQLETSISNSVNLLGDKMMVYFQSELEQINLELLEACLNVALTFMGQNGGHFEARPVPPPLLNKCDWEIEIGELDFKSSAIIGKGSFGETIKAHWKGTPVAVKRILPSLSDDRSVIQGFRHEVNLLVKLCHPNIVQFLGAVTERKPLLLITEYLRGGDLHQYLKEKGALNPSTAISFALDIARGMAYLHSEPNVIIHRDLKPRNVFLVNSSAHRLKVGDFGSSELIRMQNSHDVYKMTGETGNYRYMAPEVFKQQKYDKKVDVFSFAMILYEMLEGEPPLAHYEPYEAAIYVAEGHRPVSRAKGFIPDLRELTERCWAADKNQRPSFLKILKILEKIRDLLPSDHPWSIFTACTVPVSQK